jgi:DNA-binding NtrC family response regulator
MIRLLFIDDDPVAQKTLRMVLGGRCLVTPAPTGEEGLELLAETEIDLVLLDINLPDIDGLELLEKIMALPSPPPVVMLTAYGDARFVKQAIQAGAYDYIVKPYDLQELEGTIRRAVQNAAVCAQAAGTPAAAAALERIVGESAPVRDLKRLLCRYGVSDAPVLIQGESGTGKELVARVLWALSPRQAACFVPVSCAAIPETLLESELFGSERGAFTGAITRCGCFERAQGGTIFLDEIGEMTVSAQAKLLRVLEAKELTRVGGSRPVPLNLRVLSATNRDLKTALRENSFREDLYYRLGVLPLMLPPLRKRKEDIPLLAACFLKNLTEQPLRIQPGAAGRLQEHSWPGNVRELKNVIERAAVLASGREIRASDLVFL